MDIEQELLNDITEKANKLLDEIDKQFSRRKKEITDIFHILIISLKALETFRIK